MKDKLIKGLACVSVLAQIVSPVVSVSASGWVRDLPGLRGTYNPSRPESWAQGHTPFSNETFALMNNPGHPDYHAPDMLWGPNSCAVFSITSMFLKTGYRPEGWTPLETADWLMTPGEGARSWPRDSYEVARTETGQAWADGNVVGLSPKTNPNQREINFGYRFGILGDRSVIPGSDPDVRHLSTTTNGFTVAQINTWSLEDIPASTNAYNHAEEWIRQEYTKGRFVLLVTNMGDGSWARNTRTNHAFIMDEVTSDGEILVLDSGTGAKTLASALGGPNRPGYQTDSTIVSMYSYENLAFDSTEGPKFWRGDQINQATQMINRYRQTTKPKREGIFAIGRDENYEKVTQEGKEGVAYKNGRVVGMEPEVVEYGASTIPVEFDYEPDVSLRPGEERTKNPGVVGRSNTKFDFHIPMQRGVKAYGPDEVPFTKEERLNVDLATGERVVVQRGVPGRVDREGNTLVEMVPEVAEYGPQRRAFDTIRRPNVDLEPGDTRVVQAGQEEIKDLDGRLIQEKQDEIVEYGPDIIGFSVGYRPDLDLAPGEERVVQESEVGRIDEEGNVLVPKRDQIYAYGPDEVDFETEWEADLDLAPGVEEERRPGTVGRIDRQWNVLVDPISRQMAYGPDEVDIETVHEFDATFAPGQTQVVDEGRVGRVDRDGVVLTPMAPRVIRFGQGEVPYNTLREPDVNLAPGEEVVRQEGVNAEYGDQGAQLAAGQDEIIAYGPAEIEPELDIEMVKTLAPGVEEVVDPGVPGRIDEEGNVLIPAQRGLKHVGVELDAYDPSEFTYISDITLAPGETTQDWLEVRYGPEEIPMKTHRVAVVELEAERIVQEGSPGRIDREDQVLIEPVDRVVEYPAIMEEIVVARKASVELDPGVEEVQDEGAPSFVDEDGDIVQEGTPKVILYGAEIIPYTVNEVEDDTLEPDSREVVTQGVDGRVDEEGNVLVEPVTEEVRIGLESIPYDFEEKSSDDLPEGTKEVVREGKVGLRSKDGTVVREPVSEVTLVGVKSGGIDSPTNYDEDERPVISDPDKLEEAGPGSPVGEPNEERGEHHDVVVEEVEDPNETSLPDVTEDDDSEEASSDDHEENGDQDEQTSRPTLDLDKEDNDQDKSEEEGEVVEESGDVQREQALTPQRITSSTPPVQNTTVQQHPETLIREGKVTSGGQVQSDLPTTGEIARTGGLIGLLSSFIGSVSYYWSERRKKKKK